MKLKLSRGATINMGNYQSYKFEVGMEEDFDLNKFSIQEAYDATAKIVESFFDIEMNEAKKQRSRI